jgi:hypothetical protein
MALILTSGALSLHFRASPAVGTVIVVQLPLQQAQILRD